MSARSTPRHAQTGGDLGFAYVTQNGSFQRPCSLWEQEFRSSTDIRQPCFVSCSGVIESSLLLVCHTERLPQSPCSLWEQQLNRYPSTVFKRQPGLQPAIDPELYET